MKRSLKLPRKKRPKKLSRRRKLRRRKIQMRAIRSSPNLLRSRIKPVGSQKLNKKRRRKTQSLCKKRRSNQSQTSTSRPNQLFLSQQVQFWTSRSTFQASSSSETCDWILIRAAWCPYWRNRILWLHHLWSTKICSVAIGRLRGQRPILIP